MRNSLYGAVVRSSVWGLNTDVCISPPHTDFQFNMLFINPVRMSLLWFTSCAANSRVLVRFASADVPAVDFLAEDPDDAYEEDEIQLQIWTFTDYDTCSATIPGYSKRLSNSPGLLAKWGFLWSTTDGRQWNPNICKGNKTVPFWYIFHIHSDFSFWPSFGSDTTNALV